MTVFKHEWRQGWKSWLIWTLAIGSLVVLVNLIWPDMAGTADGWSAMFQNLGAFGDAFGLDQLNLGELLHFYGLEISNILGIGGALYAAISGINSLASEEGKHTAEFLLSHPIRRSSVIGQKLAAVLSQVTALHLTVVVMSYLSILAISETVDMELFLLFHFSLWLMTIQITLICFGISAFLTQENVGLGIGVALLLYFLNLFVNMSDRLTLLQYATPFAYADPADVLIHEALNLKIAVPQLIVSAVLTGIGWRVYSKRDLRA